jgi:hypothetical protein
MLRPMSAQEAPARRAWSTKWPMSESRRTRTPD